MIPSGYQIAIFWNDDYFYSNMDITTLVEGTSECIAGFFVEKNIKTNYMLYLPNFTNSKFK